MLDDSGLLPNNAFKLDPPAPILRPGRTFEEGHRYIIAMRELRNAEDEPLAAPATFRVFCDHHASERETVNARRESMEEIVARPEEHGVEGESLHLSRDCILRSTECLATPVLRMRDEALATPAGDAPDFEIPELRDFDEGNDSIRRTEGRMTAPNDLNAPEASAMTLRCSANSPTTAPASRTRSPPCRAPRRR